MRPMFSPSLMCADLLNLGHDIKATEAAADMYHIDIMDGHFAPNITLSPDILRAVRRATDKPLDAHLMMNDPMTLIDSVIDAGADYVTLHAEVIGAAAFRMIEHIKAKGAKVGIAFCPATPLEAAEYYLSRVDLVTVMSVDVGFGGQPFIPEMLDKVRRFAAYREEHGLDYIIQADGSCNSATYKRMHEAGVDCYVLGSGVFRKGMTLEESAARVRDDFFSVLD